jgi:ketosteroid isomerase-like protein
MSEAEIHLVTRYLAYIAAFNAGDLPAVAEHLTEDVVFDWGDTMPALVGRDAFTAFYGLAWKHFAEHLTVSDVRAEGDRLSARLETAISVHADWPDCPIEPMYAGTQFTVSGRMAYRFRGAQICHIAEEDPSTTTA